jgi:hypothetical protein
MITAIRSQPDPGALVAAYRPIVFEVEAQATDGGPRPPVVYCDIYVSGVYYKTMTRRVYTEALFTSTVFTFDIQDPLQEVLGKMIGPNGGSSVFHATDLYKTVFCKFRASVMTSGLVVPEGAEPVQGTWNSAPIPGGGFTSNNFTVVNATLQHDDSMSLETHLSSYKTGTWKTNCFPLTHRPQKQKIGTEQSDYFPMLVSGQVAYLRVRYVFKGEYDIRTATVSLTAQSFTRAVLYVPCGPKNLTAAFVTLNWNDVLYYYVELLDDVSAVVGTTTEMHPGACDGESRRIHFVNALGAVDALTLHLTAIDGDIKSDSWTGSLGTTFNRSKHATQRFAVSANRTYTGKTVDYQETEMPWIEELFRSPVSWMEWEGRQGEPDGYIPVVIQDAKFPSQKEEERYNYEVALQFRLSNETINLRN